MPICTDCGRSLELVQDAEDRLEYYTCTGCESKPYWDQAGVTIHLGNCLERMKALPAESIDAVVTDPPYGLEFMGKDWDRVQAHQAWATEALRLLKPGGHLLAFGGTRTHHRLWCALEDAGFEIRDTLMWLYGSGFPKGKATLKPAWEPIVLARKPLVGTLAANIEKHDTGALNIDECRIGTDKVERTIRGGGKNTEQWRMGKGNRTTGSSSGRWPANLVLDEEAAALLDAQSGKKVKDGHWPSSRRKPSYTSEIGQGETAIGQSELEDRRADSGGASRFFYCAKASRKERGAGNNHPTVKPLMLMRWLVRLVTPPSGLVLDPFFGSGTTALAARAEGFRCTGIDNSEEYLAIAVKRLK